MNPTGSEPEIPDIKDIIPPEPLTSIWPIIFWIAGALLVFVLLAGLLYFFILKDRNRKAPPLSPQQIALRKLREIAEKAAQLTPNEFSLQVSEALKDYLSQRFGDQLRFETSEEFITRLSQSSEGKLPDSKRELVAGFVQISDEIKFGRPPDAEEKKPHLLQQALSVVEDPIQLKSH